ncbi:hypothetical protein QE390_000960 [Siphonobacter sp. SORGH_AS 1065]|nr:hypothetical protein [Siphonobacter sp. SORGH_AS_1065]
MVAGERGDNLLQVILVNSYIGLRKTEDFAYSFVQIYPSNDWSEMAFQLDTLEWPCRLRKILTLAILYRGPPSCEKQRIERLFTTFLVDL